MRNEQIGITYKLIADKILRTFFKGDQAAIERVTSGGYNSTECLVELEPKFLATMECLSQILFEEGGISLPMAVRQAILHAGADDPLIIRASRMVREIGLTEDKKAEIAYQLMRAISRQHQESHSYEWLKKFSYETPLPNPWSIKNFKVDPLESILFIPIELCSWSLLESEFFPIAQAVMSILGIAPLHFEVEQEHRRQQKSIDINLQYEPAIQGYILENRMSYVNPIDAILRHGSFPARLAHKIYEANKPT